MLRTSFPPNLSRLLATAAVLLGGCVSYAPVLAPPAEPLVRNTGEVLAGYGAQVVEDDYVTDGVHLAARYGFGDRVSIGGMLWTQDEQVWDASVDGLAAEAIVLLNDREDPTRLALLARHNWLFNGNELVGIGVVGGLLAWLPEFWGIRPFGALQAGLGGSVASGGSNGISTMFLMLEHVGGTVELPWNLEARGELAMMQQRVRDNMGAWGGFKWAVLPSLSVSWSFTNE